VVELGTIGALREDPHASDALRKALSQMRERLEQARDRRTAADAQGQAAWRTAFAGLDPRLVGELEDDTIVLADWLDRERLEGLLDVSDEIAAHQSGSPTCSPSTADQGRAARRESSARCTRSTAPTPSSIATAAAWPRTCSTVRPQDRDPGPGRQRLHRRGPQADPRRRPGARPAEARAVPPAAGALGGLARGSLATMRGDKFSDSRRSSTRS